MRARVGCALWTLFFRKVFQAAIQTFVSRGMRAVCVRSERLRQARRAGALAIVSGGGFEFRSCVAETLLSRTCRIDGRAFVCGEWRYVSRSERVAARLRSAHERRPSRAHRTRRLVVRRPSAAPIDVVCARRSVGFFLTADETKFSF